MATKIVTKNSSTASAVPTTSDLVQGELAVNVADKRLFTEDNGGAVVELGTNPLGAVTMASTLAVAGDANFDSGTLFVDVSANAVGIGTASPSRKLTVQGGSGDTLPVRVIGGSGTTTGGIEFQDASTSGDYKVQIGSIGDNLYFRAGGAERARIDSSGNVGIGVTTVSANLHVAGNGRFDNSAGTPVRLHINNSGSNDYASIYADTATAYKNLVLNPSGGNVGIGTSSPDTLLNLASSSAPTLRIENTDTSLSAEQVVGALEFFSNDPSGKGPNVTGYIETRAADGIGAGGTMVFATGATGNSPEGERAIERMRIDASGNVGIGTSSPSVYGVDGAEDLVIGQADGDHGLTISSFGSSNGTIAFSDQTNVSVGRGYLDYDHNVNAMTVGTNGAERMRIDSSGNVLVGKTNSSLTVVGVEILPTGVLAATRNGDTMILNRLTTNGGVALFQKDSALVGNISVNASSTSYNTSSDYRLKEDDVPMTGATERVKALRPVNFAWKADGSRVDGFFAHELAEVVPEATTGTKDAMMDEEYEVTAAIEEVRDEDDNITTEAVEAVMGTRSVPDMQGIDQSKLVPLLTATIQELIARIEALETGE